MFTGPTRYRVTMFSPKTNMKKVDFCLDNFCAHIEKMMLVCSKAHLRSDPVAHHAPKTVSEASKAFQSMVSLYAVTQPVGKVGCILES